MSGGQAHSDVDAAWFWDRYWHSDRVASCSGAGGRNYRAEIRRTWADFFLTLPDHATILDICTGNGAIALIAAETARQSGKNFIIHAVDRANIDPKRFLHSAPAAQIHFHGKTSAENTRLPAHCFDAICGQYAFEYTDRPRTIAEITRLLKRGGSLRFILHAAEGGVVDSAKHQINDARVLLEQTDFFNLARRLLIATFEAETTTGGPAAGAFRNVKALQQTFQATLEQLRRHAAVAHDQAMFENVVGVIAHALAQHRNSGCELVLRKIDEAETETRAYRARLEAMVAAAVTRPQAGEIADELSRRIGGTLSVHPVRAAPAALLGWALSA